MHSKMKKALIAVTVSFMAFSVHAQVRIDDIPIEREFSHVFYSDIPINKKMVNAKTWIAKTFGDYKAVLQYEDGVNNRIIIKGKTSEEKSSLDESLNQTEQYSFTMTFDFKEDRYRIKVENIAKTIAISQGGRTVYTTEPWESLFNLDYMVAAANEVLKTELRMAESASPPKHMTDRRKKEYKENSAKRIKEIEDKINNQEAIIQETRNSIAENETQFKAVFYILLISAANGVEVEDEF